MIYLFSHLSYFILISFNSIDIILIVSIKFGRLYIMIGTFPTVVYLNLYYVKT